uniref:Uncharacterized protein n=1 Tax=Steinernema glaseri TaxID=37863 RepID=A0A1I8AUE9_9BILA
MARPSERRNNLHYIKQYPAFLEIIELAEIVTLVKDWAHVIVNNDNVLLLLHSCALFPPADVDGSPDPEKIKNDIKKKTF